MELTSESFIKLMADQFKSESEKIDLDIEFRSLYDWSSLQALIVITAIDDEFGVTIEDSELRQANSFRDLFHLIEAKR